MAARPLRLRQASAYYRLAAKARRAGQGRQADWYLAVAERLVRENRREQERLSSMRRR